MTRDILRTGRLEMLLAAAGSIRSMPLVTYLSFGRALRAADLHGRSTGENAGAERAVSKQGRRPRMDGELNTSLADRCSRASPSSSNERERRGTSSGNGCAWEAPRRQLWREGAIRLAKAPAACHSSKRLIFGSAQKSQPVTFSERRLVPFSPGHVFQVVSSVQDYQHFVPWCQRSEVLKRVGDTYMEAELEVGFQVFRERYTSVVSFTRPDGSEPGKVCSAVRDSALFEHLDSTWKMAPGPRQGTTWLSIDVDFAFRSQLYSHVSQMFLDEVVRRMMMAFEARCAELPDTSKAVQGGAS